MLQPDKIAAAHGRLQFIKGVFMLDSIQSLLDAFPEGVVQVRAGQVLNSNEKARQYLPQLTPGSSLPSCITLPEQGAPGTGVFVFGSMAYSYSCKSVQEEYVILFRPTPREGLRDWQLDGVLRQLRTLMGDLLSAAEPDAAPAGEPNAAFSKTFHRLFRLMNNLEFMRLAAGEQGIPFHPVTMDLAGLCRDTVRPAADLLWDAGVSLEYRSHEDGLLIPGDPELLRRLLLGLFSNAARAAGEGGRVSLTLRRSGSLAILVVANSGPALTPRQLAALLRENPGEDLPLPGQGAGLGLPIARHIALLHGGKLLIQGNGRTPSVLTALPTGPLSGRTSLHTPGVQRDGGLDPVLTELSDILPAAVFGLETLD